MCWSLPRGNGLKSLRAGWYFGEADRNLRREAPPAAFKTFHRFLQQVKVRVISPPTEEVISSYEGLIDPKDLPVLAAAVVSQADFLLTLDRKHFLSSELVSKVKKPRIFSPADFLRDFYLKGKI